MILLEVDPVGITILELECYAPRPIYMDGVARRLLSMERMEIETGNVHIFRLLSAIEGVQTPQDSPVQR